eukprot:8716822-Pyramimonas_sp.AAC.1
MPSGKPRLCKRGTEVLRSSEQELEEITNARPGAGANDMHFPRRLSNEVLFHLAALMILDASSATCTAEATAAFT